MISFIKYVFNFILDRFFFIINLQNKVNELRIIEDNKKLYDDVKRIYPSFNIDTETEELDKMNWLNEWNTIFRYNLNITIKDVNYIYLLKLTYDLPNVRNKLEYYVSNKFWNLLENWEIDTWNWSNDQVFGTPAIALFLIKYKDNKQKIIFVGIYNRGSLTYLKSYDVYNLWINWFRSRKLIYNKKHDFIQI